MTHWLDVPDALSIIVHDHNCYLGHPHEVQPAWGNNASYCDNCSLRMWLDTNGEWYGIRRAYRIEEVPW